MMLGEVVGVEAVPVEGLDDLEARVVERAQRRAVAIAIDISASTSGTPTATSAPNTITPGLPILGISTTGSHIASPNRRIVALVTATPMKANSVIVVGSPSA